MVSQIRVGSDQKSREMIRLGDLLTVSLWRPVFALPVVFAFP